MKRTHLTATVALLSLTTLGCAAGRQSDALTRELPYASRVELLDAEYRLTLADEEVRRAGAAVRQAHEELARAERELDAAKEDPTTADAAKARVEFLRANDGLANEKLRLARAQASCARLAYERDRMRLIAREQVAAPGKIREGPGQEQLAECQQTVDGVEAAADERQTKARAAREEWERANARAMLERPARAEDPYLD